MTLSLVSMENIVSQGSMNSRQEKAEESEKPGNRAAAAEPGQWEKAAQGWHQCLTGGLSQGSACMYRLHSCRSQPGFPASYSGKTTGYFYKSSPLQKSLPQITP